jgi:ammonium transporter, Amt family
MNATLKTLILGLAIACAWPAMAQDAMTVTEGAASVVEAVESAAAAAGEAVTAAVEEAAPAPSADKGDTAWMMISTVLVILMTIPGLALFYGGMVRAKNMLSVLMQVFITFCLLGLLWSIYGYSVAFTEGNAFFGGLSKAFLSGVTTDSLAATWSKGVYIPEYVYIVFQLTFAAITPALIAGAFAERMKFSAVLMFMVIWFTFSYLPIAHMVWYWAGPDAYMDAESAAAATATAGYLFQKGAMDFAGGTVVHINAGIAGLVGCIMIGKRVGYGREAMPPHNLVMTMVGASLLWVGWFGFNVGSNLEATGLAAMVMLNTTLATAAATLSWMFLEWLVRGKPTMLGAASGAIAGLVAITPACGFVGPMGSIVLGAAAGIVCLWAVVWLKSKLGYDDSLDVFGVHCVGGILGALGTGIFASPSLGGISWWDYVANAPGEFAIGGQLKVQAIAVIVALVWSAVVAAVGFKLTDLIIGLRVSDDDERQGLDETLHGEAAYHT